MYIRYVPGPDGGFLRTQVPDAPRPVPPPPPDLAAPPPLAPPAPPVGQPAGRAPQPHPPPPRRRQPDRRMGPGPPFGLLAGLTRGRDVEDWLILAVLVLGLLSEGEDMTTALLAAGLYWLDIPLLPRLGPQGPERKP